MLLLHLNALVLPTFTNPYYEITKTSTSISIRAYIQTYGSYINRVGWLVRCCPSAFKKSRRHYCLFEVGVGLGTQASFSFLRNKNYFVCLFVDLYYRTSYDKLIQKELDEHNSQGIYCSPNLAKWSSKGSIISYPTLIQGLGVVSMFLLFGSDQSTISLL